MDASHVSVACRGFSQSYVSIEHARARRGGGGRGGKSSLSRGGSLPPSPVGPAKRKGEVNSRNEAPTMTKPGNSFPALLNCKYIF